jgi:uncharacterized protein YjeT (DUF2065 family)
MDYFLSVLGMVLVIEALPYIAFPGQLKKYVQMILAMPERNLQIIGLIMAFSGLALVYVARGTGLK